VVGDAALRRESPSESWSYVAMDRQGLPMPEPQVTVGDERGRPIGRVDGWWATFAAIAEVDGAVKYGIGTDLAPDDARRALYLEKQRERGEAVGCRRSRPARGDAAGARTGRMVSNGRLVSKGGGGGRLTKR
jgi:hypothetical protein